MRNLRPAGHRLLVRVEKPKDNVEMSSGGIITKLNNTDERHTLGGQEATVITVGSNAFKAFDGGEAWCKQGDRVLIAKYAGEDRRDIEENQICRIINDDDILGVFEGE